MYNCIPPNKNNKGIGDAIVGGVGQVVDAYNLRPGNQDTTTYPTTPPPAGDPPSASPGSGPDSKSTNASPTFRPKGPITAPVKGKVKGPTVKSTATKPPPK